MEKKHSNINLSGLSLFCLRILMWNTRIRCFLSFFLFCFQFVFTYVSQHWTKTRRNCATSEPVKQNGVRMSREEVILVMEKLGMNVHLDEEGTEEFCEQEIEQLFEEDVSLEEVEEVFNVFDQNKDGFIEARELKRVLTCLGLGKDLEECQKMINAVDQNGDELIDQSEFVMIMEQSFG